MSGRERRRHSSIRRLGARIVRPSSATAETEIDGARSPEAEADALIATFRARAYSEARRRQRQARSREAAAHWGHVARIIARRSRAAPGIEPPLRRAMGANLTPDREGWPVRAPEPFSEVRQLDELERILNARPQQFRLQFFAVAGADGPAIVAEADIQATDASDAIRAAADAPLPPQAIGVRVLDREGREIFEQLKADRG
jgi:hypothetical protein